MSALVRTTSMILLLVLLGRCGLFPADTTVHAPAPESATSAAELEESAAADPTLIPAAVFISMEKDGRLWVFLAGSEELAAAQSGEFSEKHVTAVGAGPDGVTVKAPDADVLLAYLSLRPGYEAYPVDGRVWVFAAGSEEALEFRRGHRSEKHVSAIGAGPSGATVKAPDTETLNGYLAAADGFVTAVVDGRVWVFQPDSEEAAAFLRGDVSEKHVTAVGAGPMGMTVKASDVLTLNRYLEVIAAR